MKNVTVECRAILYIKFMDEMIYLYIYLVGGYCFLHQLEKLGVRVVGPNAVDSYPGYRVQPFPYEQVAYRLGPLDIQGHHIIGDSDFRGLEFHDQLAPFGDYILRGTGTPDIPGDGLGAIDALIWAAAGGDDGVGARPGIQPIGQRLQVGVPLDLVQVMRGEGQAVQVSTGRTE